VDLPGARIQLDNTSAGRAKLCQKLQAIPGAHVVCEATGGYERALVQSIHDAKLTISVVNPAQVRASAQAQGQRAKTDAIDALMLTQYGQRYQPAPTPLISQVQRRLSALTQWLQQLIEAQAIAKAQAEHHHDTFVRQQHEALIDHYESQIQATTTELKMLMEQDQELQQRVQCLDAIEGVGLRTALVVLTHLPELGQLNRQQIAALAGLAPWTRESGAMKGKSCIGGGRPKVRTALYMSSLSVVRWNPTLRSFYERLVGKGKPKKVALTAVMRKLLVHMNHQLKTLASTASAAAQPA